MARSCTASASGHSWGTPRPTVSVLPLHVLRIDRVLPWTACASSHSLGMPRPTVSSILPLLLHVVPLPYFQAMTCRVVLRILPARLPCLLVGMANCDSCGEWFHARCVGLSQAQMRSLKRYVCPVCIAVKVSRARGCRQGWEGWAGKEGGTSSWLAGQLESMARLRLNVVQASSRCATLRRRKCQGC